MGIRTSSRNPQNAERGNDDPAAIVHDITSVDLYHLCQLFTKLKRRQILTSIPSAMLVCAL